MLETCDADTREWLYTETNIFKVQKQQEEKHKHDRMNAVDCYGIRRSGITNALTIDTFYISTMHGMSLKFESVFV